MAKNTLNNYITGRMDVSPVLGDINSDGQVEIFVATGEYPNNAIYAWDSSGNILSGNWPISNMGIHYAPRLALSDINNDSKMELLIPSAIYNLLYAVDSTGSPYIPSLWAAMVSQSSPHSGPSIGDIDGDGTPEAVIGAFDNKLNAFNHDSTIMQKWPKITDSRIDIVPAIGDLDGDGDVEVVSASYNGVVFVHDLNGAYDDSTMQWPMFQHDPQHTGYYPSSIVDTTAPVITLFGITLVDVEVGTTYVDAGATATDNVDGDISASIITGGLPIDTSALGSYTVTYDVTDSSGNAAVQVTRTVNVIDTSTPVIISSVDFEEGWDIWIDGGADASRISKAAYANSGKYCIRLRDNTSTSVMTTDNLDLSTYSEIEVQFSYFCRSMDNSNEDFWLQISTDGGSSFITVEEWNRNDEFLNKERHNETVVISSVSLSSNTKLRFRCDASGNQDWVYIDDVIITAR